VLGVRLELKVNVFTMKMGICLKHKIMKHPKVRNEYGK